MSRPVVLKLGNTRFAHKAWDELGRIADVVTVNKAVTRPEFLRMLRDPNSPASRAQVVTRTFASVQQTGLFDRELAEHLPASVVAVCQNGAGYDQIDPESFTKRQIQVANVPGLVNAPTADTHVFLLLAALRNFCHGQLLLRQGRWPDAPVAGTPFGHDPAGKTVGVLGMGGIGRAVVQRLRPFGFERIIYHNRNRLSSELECSCEYVSFEELLAQSDILSVNVPLSSATRHMLDADAIARMKDGVLVVNTARGPIFDEQALIAALQSGKISAAGLDVYENEPHVPQALLELPNVVCLPHMGTHTVESIKKMEEFVVENVHSVLRTGRVKSLIPELRNAPWLASTVPLIPQSDY
ncbi:AFR675Wp [Eremothecium gossypii ATCC 10895]|uniref:AFR675Wp n=1 Tax=Eremothecium gossypii (strain ATCC 10895 / CBS 109.51 / FGSC 9923 / NRRL Y-1056) TaxID=284811 RepID=Q752A0_EREGS|nr:AFR675Wp [Eremothecium gossypii ATCC 10895]AAS54047.1 AFR675Wp [Eremothecium gossypii ATCC 10895]AEY98362.1 FAFR675Wp [Eremothecium gossypii FDAG1]